MNNDKFYEAFFSGVLDGLKLLCLVLVIGILGKATPAAAEVSITETHGTKYVCVNGDQVSPATGSIVSSRQTCSEIAATVPGDEVFLVHSTTIVFTPEPEKEWVVAPIWNSDTRAMYECGSDCEANNSRGAKVGRSDVELVGRCEGPLSPVWGGVTSQWQYHTNADGIRGLVYCKLAVPAGPPPTIPPVEPVEPVPEFMGLSGPNTPTIYPSNEAMKAAQSVWRISYDLDAASGDVGLISRDLTGQPQGGHFDVRINAQGYIVARMQGLNSGLVELNSQVPAVGGPQVVEIIRSEDKVELHLNGFPQDSTTEIYPMDQNDLSLVVGASCQSCTTDATGIKWVAPMTVLLELYTGKTPGPVDPEVLPPIDPPANGIYNATGSWSRPATNTDGTPVTGDLFYTVYWGTQSGVYDHKIETGLNELSAIIPLPVGATYYLVVSATNAAGNESPYSDEVEKIVPAE